MRLPSVVVLTSVGSLSSALKVAEGEDAQAIITVTDRQRDVAIQPHLDVEALEVLAMGLMDQVRALRGTPKGE